MIVLHSSMGEKGQVVIPKPIRDLLNIGPKDDLIFRLEDDKIIIEHKDPEDLLMRLLSTIPHKEKEPESIDWDEECGSQFGG